MILFDDSKNRDDIEDHLFWIYKVTYEIEMHINALLSLNNLLREFNLYSDQARDMMFYHHELALLRTASILKNKPRRDEKHSLYPLQDYIEGKRIKKNKHISLIFKKIDEFYVDHQNDIDKLVNNRDAEAHTFKLEILLKRHKENEVSLHRHLSINFKVRNLITELHYVLFGRDLPKELEYDTQIYEAIYSNGLPKTNLK